MSKWWSNASVPLLLSLTIILYSQQTGSAQQSGTVRLVDGPSSNCGRVEVFYNGSWGTICSNDSVAENDWGTVVCKQLGYERVSQSFNYSHFGEGEGRIWLDDLLCAPSNKSVMDCKHSRWGVHKCTHAGDIGVCCDPRPPVLPVRLTCPNCTDSTLCKICPDKLHPSSCREEPTVAGVVEVQVNGVWGPISAEGWDVKEATVVCGQLGYPISFPSGAAPPTAEDIGLNYTLLSEANSTLDNCHQSNYDDLRQFYKNLSYSFLQGLDCSGKESQLLDCFMSGVDYQPNPTQRVATVRCGFKPHYKCLPQSQRTYRLRAGAVPWVGRAEIKSSGVWGTICDDEFDMLEGNIICRRLGYGTVKTISGQAGYGRGVEKIHFTQIHCTGTEDRIEDCVSTKGTRAQQCGHGRDVGLECNTPATHQCPQDTLHNVDLVESEDHTYPRVRGTSGWGLFCHSNTPAITRAVGEVICRQTRRQFLAKISKGPGPVNYNGLNYTGSIHCIGSKTLLSSCRVSITPQSSCPEGYTIVDCTPAAADLVPDISFLKTSLESFFGIQEREMYTLQCALEEGCLSSSARPNGNPRTLMTFDSMTWNWGLADFKPVTPEEDWEWHSCHYHYHSMEEFVHYDLRYFHSGRDVAAGHKASFCLEDSICVKGYSKRFSCILGIQGISPNCGDLYGQFLDCQWIDITRVSHDEYLLELSVNPQHIALESDYKNNIATCRIEYTQIYDRMSRKWRDVVEVEECWLSDH